MWNVPVVCAFPELIQLMLDRVGLNNESIHGPESIPGKGGIEWPTFMRENIVAEADHSGMSVAAGAPSNSAEAGTEERKPESDDQEVRASVAKERADRYPVERIDGIDQLGCRGGMRALARLFLCLAGEENRRILSLESDRICVVPSGERFGQQGIVMGNSAAQRVGGADECYFHERARRLDRDGFVDFGSMREGSPNPTVS
jgi:hypothetical protein